MMRKNGSYKQLKGQSDIAHAVKSKKIEVYEKEIKNARVHNWSDNKLHVMKNNNGGWCVKVNLSDSEFPIFKTQQNAIDHAIDKARTQKNTQIIIYAKSGKIREKMKF